MLLLSILTFITVVLIMTGALVPVLMYCAAIAAVLYVLLLIKRLVVDLLWSGSGSAGSNPQLPAQDETIPGEYNDKEGEQEPGNRGEADE